MKKLMLIAPLFLSVFFVNAQNNEPCNCLFPTASISGGGPANMYAEFGLAGFIPTTNTFAVYVGVKGHDKFVKMYQGSAITTTVASSYVRVTYSLNNTDGKEGSGYLKHYVTIYYGLGVRGISYRLNLVLGDNLMINAEPNWSFENYVGDPVTNKKALLIKQASNKLGLNIGLTFRFKY